MKQKRTKCAKADRCKNADDPELCHDDVFDMTQLCFELDTGYVIQPSYAKKLKRRTKKNGQ